MNSGIPLTDTIRNFLFENAQTMYQKEKKLLKISNPHYEGNVSSDWSVKGLGGITGIVFIASIETDYGKVSVEYLIPRKFLEGAIKGHITWSDSGVDTMSQPVHLN